MLNLLKFSEFAKYSDGTDTKLSGFEAYQRYAMEVTKIISKVGGEIVFNGQANTLVIGDGELDNLSFLRGEIENSVATNVGDHDALIARHEDAASEGIIQIVWVQGGRFFNLAGDWNEADARRRAIGISDSVQRAV